MKIPPTAVALTLVAGSILALTYQAMKLRESYDRGAGSILARAAGGLS